MDASMSHQSLQLVLASPPNPGSFPPGLFEFFNLLVLHFFKVVLSVAVPYYAARRSLQTRRALEILDRSVEGREYMRQHRGEKSAWRGSTNAVVLIGLVILVGVPMYRRIMYDDTESFGILFVACMCGIAFSGFAMIFSTLSVDSVVLRAPRISEAPYAVKARDEYFKARMLSYILAVVLTILTFKTENALLLSCVAGAFVFGGASEPGPGSSSNILFGAGLAFMWGAQSAAFMRIEPVESEDVSRLSTAFYSGFQEVLGLFSVMVMTTVFRYEATTSSGGATQEKATEERAPVSYRTIKRYDSWKSYLLCEKPAGLERVPYVALSAVRCTTPSAPLFNFLVALTFFSRALASLAFLSVQLLGLEKTGASMIYDTIFRAVEEIPAQAGTNMLVAIAILVAILVRKDGRRMRNSVEIWEFQEKVEGHGKALQEAKV